MSPDEPPTLHTESLVVAAGRPTIPGAPVNAPVVLAAPFRSAPEDNPYARQAGTETLHAFESAIGVLEGGTALAFASGMAAVAAVVEGQPAGGVAVAPASGYSGTVSLFAEQARLGRMTVRPVELSDTAAVIAALNGEPPADLLWLESVTNPLLTVPDLPALVAAAHGVGAVVAVDATFSTPLLLRALDLGVDVVMHSATKSISGHSDLLMGLLVTRDAERAAALHARRSLTGAIPGALECYLALRGLRTLAVRMQRAQANAQELAERLSGLGAVRRVRYPGLPTDPNFARAQRQFAGAGAMLAFELDSAETAERVCAEVELITHATSLGGVETLIERRGRYPVDAAHGTPPELLRLSVGIENVEDLWRDLLAAIERATGAG